MSNARVCLIYNEKGGVGKTSCTGIFMYLLARKGYKVLGVDLDPQHNLTDMIASTYRDGKHFHPPLKLYKAIENNDLKTAICNAGTNLDIAPSDLSLVRFQSWDNQLSVPVKDQIINETLKPFLNKYDFIFLDVPPTFNPFSLNAIYAATDIILLVQTQKSSFTSAIDTVSMLNELHKTYNFNFNFVGVVLYLMINAKVDHDIKNQSIEAFKNYVFKHKIKYQERVKGFTDYGITDKDQWDKRSLKMYSMLVNEILNRMGVSNE